MAIFETPHEHFVFQPGQQFNEMLGELKPGQTAYVKRPYILVPDGKSQSIFNPALSSATFVGETEHPGDGIEAVEPPPLYTESAPSDTPETCICSGNRCQAQKATRCSPPRRSTRRSRTRR